MDKITHEMRLSYWAPVINQCRQSGMTVRIWCLENNVNEKRFYYWQRRLREEAYEMSKGTVPATDTAVFAAIPSSIMGAENHGSFQPDIILKSGNLIIEISNTASDILLSRIGGMIHHAL